MYWNSLKQTYEIDFNTQELGFDIHTETTLLTYSTVQKTKG